MLTFAGRQNVNTLVVPTIKKSNNIKKHNTNTNRHRAISWASGCKISAIRKSLGPRGVGFPIHPSMYFPIHPSSRQCADTVLHRLRSRERWFNWVRHNISYIVEWQSDPGGRVCYGFVTRAEILNPCLNRQHYCSSLNSYIYGNGESKMMTILIKTSEGTEQEEDIKHQN